MLVNFLQNKGCCKKGETHDIPDSSVYSLLARGIVEKVEKKEIIKKTTKEIYNVRRE